MKEVLNWSPGEYERHLLVAEILQRIFVARSTDVINCEMIKNHSHLWIVEKAEERDIWIMKHNDKTQIKQIQLVPMS